MAKIPIKQIVRICNQIIEATNNTNIIRQELDHANTLLKEAVSGFEDVKDFLDEVIHLKNEGVLNKSEAEKVMVCLAHLYREQISFEKACLDVINRY